MGYHLELLQTQFSKHLKDAATDLGVGSTTLKTDLSSIRHCALASTIVEIKAEQSAERSRESTKQIEESEVVALVDTVRVISATLSFRSPGGSDIVAGESVHGPGDRMNGGGLLSNLTLENGGGGANGNPLGDGLFKMGSTGVPIGLVEVIAPAWWNKKRNSRERRAFARWVPVCWHSRHKDAPIHWGDEHEPERGASWHAGSGFISHGRLKKCKGSNCCLGSSQPRRSERASVYRSRTAQNVHRARHATISVPCKRASSKYETILKRRHRWGNLP